MFTAGRPGLMLVVVGSDVVSDGRRRDKIVHPVWPRDHEQDTKNQQAPQGTSTMHMGTHGLRPHVGW